MARQWVEVDKSKARERVRKDKTHSLSRNSVSKKAVSIVSMLTVTLRKHLFASIERVVSVESTGICGKGQKGE
jgi:hypothetical protein